MENLARCNQKMLSLLKNCCLNLENYEIYKFYVTQLAYKYSFSFRDIYNSLTRVFKTNKLLNCDIIFS